jgi:hypothetical protein
VDIQNNVCLGKSANVRVLEGQDFDMFRDFCVDWC